MTEEESENFPLFFVKSVDSKYWITYINYSKQSGRLAQLGERHPYKVDVGGSIPSTPTTFFIKIGSRKWSFFLPFFLLLILFFSRNELINQFFYS